MNIINHNKPLLSICIPSYNRPKELIRCLNSIDAKSIEKIEIVISDDCSPLRQLITNDINIFKSDSKFDIRYLSNNINLGYDQNLGNLIEKSKGEYTLFISDDDMFIAGSIDKIIDYLIKERPALAFTPFYNENEEDFGRKFNKDFKILPESKDIYKYLYSSILFSGLIFRRDLIVNIDSKRFKNSIYYQVYLFMIILYRYGGMYINIPNVKCVGDGENGFGRSDSSEKNELLANRSSVFSNLEYHKHLIKVIDEIDNDLKLNLKEYFSKEYSLRSISGLSAARKISKNTLKEYWYMMNKLDINIFFVAKVYYLILLYLGNDITNTLFKMPRKLIIFIKGQLR